MQKEFFDMEETAHRNNWVLTGVQSRAALYKGLN
jgi:hypothetical protein